MPIGYSKEYLVGEKIFELTSEKRIMPVSKEEEDKIKNLSKKERALRFRGFIITNTLGEIILEDRKKYIQHFFPLSVIDYIKKMYDFEKNNQEIPILSVDSHDILSCDFKCQDCLSAHGTSFPVKEFPKHNFDMNLDIYKNILKEIVNYSKKMGFDLVHISKRLEEKENPALSKKERKSIYNLLKLTSDNFKVLLPRSLNNKFARRFKIDPKRGNVSSCDFSKHRKVLSEKSFYPCYTSEIILQGKVKEKGKNTLSKDCFDCACIYENDMLNDIKSKAKRYKEVSFALNI